MIVGGLMFGVSALKAKVLSRIALALFVIGLMLNLIVSLLPVPEVVQILGSTIRNFGADRDRGLSPARADVRFYIRRLTSLCYPKTRNLELGFADVQRVR